MAKGIKISAIGVAGILLLFILLVSVRFFESRLFYDPLIEFFKNENKVLPDYDTIKLLLNLAMRYLLNTLISIGIIYLIFKDRAIIKLTTLLYALFFILLISAFSIIISSEKVNLLLLFYIRRFIIHPIFLLLFIPAFYYQKTARIKEN
ncbi:exosortase F system-associated protein [Flavobacterium sp. MK4S-17]|uniref:exosortase F system-associated membrane protein n=1 Tax=Flavobacterium sp. MK4S-17 TaxID=2543737 RepID=UPI00135AC033|nr:exosortase F system-associated protein [Flavobacterium sp. MK4S-17]